MKPIFLVLLLINIGFALWEFRSGAFDEPKAPSVLPTLLLSDEAIKARRGAFISAIIDRQVDDAYRLELTSLLIQLSDAQRWQDAAMKLAIPVKLSPTLPGVALRPANSPEPSPVKAALICYEVGPFAEMSLLKQWLKAKALSAIDTATKDVNIESDFQVYYPAAKGSEQLQLNKQMLIAKDVTDFWMVPSGDNKGALSLGVFSDHQRAQNFRSQLLAKGIAVEVKQRFKTQPQFYARVMIEKSRRESLVGRALQIVTCPR